jgi:hypothetical protein
MDVALRQLKDPSSFKDLMGYCDNTWVSDYVYGNFFTRTQALAQQASFEAGPAERWRAYAVRADGSLWDAGSSERVRRPGGEKVRVHTRSLAGDAGSTEGVFLPADHVPGGMLLVPEQDGVTAVRLER